MKRGNLANKLLLGVAIVTTALITGLVTFGIIYWSQPRPEVPNYPTLSQAEIQMPLYTFDKTNKVLETLGIKAYNDYLFEVSQNTPLPEVVVAIIDSGINMEHQCFQGRVVQEYARNFNPAAGDSAAWNFDLSGHGSHVAGLIVDSTMSNVKILPLKIFRGTADEKISGAIIADTINYIIKLKNESHLNIIAVNMSLGTVATENPNSTEYANNNAAYETIVNSLRDNEILPIVAAGNHKDGYALKAYYSFPSACQGALAVSAYDHNDKYHGLASFSNFGKHISLSAPGNNILSASNEGTDQTRFNNGTSMATPYVTVCYALLMSDVSKTTAANLGVSWDHTDTQAPYFYLNPQHKALLLAATDYGAPGIDVAYGYGAVNVSSFAVPADQIVFKPSKTVDELLVSGIVVSADTAENSDVDWNAVFWLIAGGVAILFLIYCCRFAFGKGGTRT